MKQDFDIKIAQTAEEIQAAMQLRREVFVGEEGVPEDKEFDGNDFVCCTHFYAKDKDNVIGCVRARFFPDFVKLERLCYNTSRNRNVTFVIIYLRSFNM